MPQNVSPGWMVWVPQPAAQHYDIRGVEAPGVQEMERTALLGAAAQSVGQGADRLVCGPSRRQEVHDSHDQGCSTVNQPQLSLKFHSFYTMQSAVALYSLGHWGQHMPAQQWQQRTLHAS
jgi:hypothetical protein